MLMVNRGAGYGLKVHCRYTINGNKVAVRWLKELTLKKMTFVKDAVVRNLETKTGRKRMTIFGDEMITSQLTYTVEVN